MLPFFETGNLEVEVNGIPQKYQRHLFKVPYNAKITLNCKSQNFELLLSILL